MLRRKGFTLIELLVVIAIIGILASIVLVSLTGARDKARDARVIAGMGQLRTLSELYHEDNSGSYASLDCTTGGTEMDAVCNDIDSENAANGGVPTFRAAASAYCATAALRTSQEWYCIDSSGRAVQASGATNPYDVASACGATTTTYDCVP